jgi:hypothetical protein
MRSRGNNWDKAGGEATGIPRIREMPMKRERYNQRGTSGIGIFLVRSFTGPPFPAPKRTNIEDCRVVLSTLPENFSGNVQKF